MILHETELSGVVLVELQPHRDERGSFARTFDAELFAAHGLDARIVQCNASVNARAGTLRGLHYQAPPFQEGKLVRCTRGRIYDVVVDLRADSPTHRSWLAFELGADEPCSLFIAGGLAHGFQTLADATEVHYQMTAPYVPSAARGVRFDDPAFAIDWPAPPRGERIVSPRDLAFPDYAPERTPLCPAPERTPLCPAPEQRSVCPAPEQTPLYPDHAPQRAPV